MNKFYSFVILIIMSVMLSCAESNTPPTTNNTPTPAPDNTARNAQDANTKAVTPTDQLENSTDLKVTQEIRKSIMNDNSLSTYGKNVKVVTQENVVTLRGVVNSAQEKRRIETIAKQIATTKNVDNQLEVKTKS